MKKMHGIFVKSLFSILSIVLLEGAQAQIFRHSAFEVVYSKAQLDNVDCIHKTLFNLPMNIDASLSILKDGQSMRTLWTSPWGLNWYTGSFESKSIFSTKLYEGESGSLSNSIPGIWVGGASSLNKNYSGPATIDVVGFISSVYKISSTELIGFIHIERSNVSMSAPTAPDRLYAIGIAHSNDFGNTWTYAGDVIRPKYDQLGDGWSYNSTVKFYSNIGGVPYSIVNDAGQNYVYIYYNEYINNSTRQYPAVARSKLSDVIADAKNGSIGTPWRKFIANTGNSWSEDGLTGEGSPILSVTLNNPFAAFYDLHSDAGYSVPMKKHLLLANRVELNGVNVHRKLLLFSSSDGINWPINTIIDESVDGQTNQYSPFYASFISLAPGASDDFSSFGSEFYVIYPRQYNFDYLNSDLYTKKINVFPDIGPAIRNLLL